MSIKQVAKEIKKYDVDIIVITGGEPMLQQEELYKLLFELDGKYSVHLETNGDILPQLPELFTYIAFSPKEKKVAQNVFPFCCLLNETIKWDIKIVTDLEMGAEMIQYASILMPLSTYNKEEDLKIQQKVWTYCSENNIKYTPRIHKDVWGAKIGK